MFHKDTHQVYRVTELEPYAWLDLGFGTRLSDGWPPAPLIRLKQVHSSICVCADEVAETIATGDALVSSTPGRTLSVRTADCIPILMVDLRLRAIAAVHAGWRGTAEGISSCTQAVLASRYGSRPEDLSVAIGPGICCKCYTIGPEVAERFRAWFPEWSRLGTPATLDLAEANRRQLVAAGVPECRIYTGAPCTSCRPEEFYSHRRSGGKPGRMISAVRIRS